MSDAFEPLMQRQIAWAHTYDGYRRLAGGDEGPTALAQLLQPAWREFQDTGRVPEWCGVDLLRGWAFYLTREDRHGGGYNLAEGGTKVPEWDAVLQRIASHPGTRPEERPPLRTLQVSGPRGPFTTEPRRHRDREFLAAKQARWFEPHVAPVNALVQEIARTVGGDVPYVDPDSGGVNARVLFILEAPAGAAAHGSNMLSADNDDGTAANVWRAYQHSGLPREWGIHWNAVPWYLGVRGKIAAAKTQDIEDGRQWLLRLVDLLPDLVVAVCLGNAARDAVAPTISLLASRGVEVLNAPHPSQRRYNVSKGADEVKVHAVFKKAMGLAHAR